jgi:hypothetical protein
VTSASLVGALHDSGTNGHDKVQVCAADNHLLIAIVYFK